MTGTALTEATEFMKIYKVPVVEIPTNRPMVRADHNDQIFKTKDGKWKAVLEEIIARHEAGQPILVGTVSVEVSEMISGELKRRGIEHAVLNAKPEHAEREGERIAQAGRRGAVMIATNMAGRGVDIKLGGDPEHLAHARAEEAGDRARATRATRRRWPRRPPSWSRRCKAEAEEVRELGGLFICGTERHESRRIDNQLRGRSGRQGDPGETRFFLSAEDDVIRLFAGDRIYKILDKLGPVDDEGNEMPLEAKMLTKTVENAQKKVEEQNFLIRKRVLEYDDVMNEQRRVVYKYRGEILEGRDMSDVARDELEGVIERLVDEYTPGDELEEWDLPELDVQLRQIWPVGIDVAAMAPETVDREKLKDELDEDAMNAYDEREEKLAAQGGEELMRQLERSILLQVIDNRWREHLYDMDYLREGIHLRGFAQIDPLVAYKNEGFAMFEELMHSIWEEFSKLVFHAEIEFEPGQPKASSRATAGPSRPPSTTPAARCEGQPSALQQVAAGAGGGEMAGGRRGRRRGGDRQRRPRAGRDRGQGRARQNRPQRPLLVRQRQEVQEVPRRLRARWRSPDPVREFIRAFNERDLDAFVAVLDPEVELHSMRGLRKGVEAARLWATRPPGGVQQTIELEQLYEDGTEGGGGTAVALIRRALALGRGRLGRRRRRDGLGLRAARAQDPQLAPLRGSGRGAARRRLHRDRRFSPYGGNRRAARAYHRLRGIGRGREPGGDGRLERPALRALRPVPRAGRRRASARTARWRWRPTRRGRATGCSTSAAASATRPSGSPGWSAPEGEALGVDVSEPFIELARAEEAEAGCDNVDVRSRRRAGRRAAEGVRLRLLAHGGHVLRQPGAGAAQRPRGAGSGRPALRGRLAAQARQRVDAPRRAGRRGVPRSPRGERRADLRARALLDGQCRHRQRAADDRRLRGDQLAGAATCR